jgi:hypothetical protein
MAERVVRTSKRLAAERQIHAAIAHFRAGDFECAITLSHAAEGRLPQPSDPADLFSRLKRFTAEHAAPDGQKDDFNFFANWMKHEVGPDEIESNRCGGITYKFCARVEMMSSVAD